MREEQQPPEDQRAGPASADGAGDEVAPPAGGADPALPEAAGQVLPPDASAPDASSPNASERTQEMHPDTPAAAAAAGPDPAPGGSPGGGGGASGYGLGHGAPGYGGASYGSGQGPAGDPGYGGGPGYGSGPGHGSGQETGGGSWYASGQGAGGGPGYGDSPGYGYGAGYGAGPGYSGGSGYDGGAGYGSGSGYASGSGYGGYSAGGGPGYGGPGYGPGYPGGYGPSEYGSGGYGPSEYGSGGQYPPGGGYRLPGDIIGGGYGHDRPPRRGSRIVTYVVVAALAAGVGAGAVLAVNHNAGNSTPSAGLPGAGAVPRPGGGAGSGGGTNASRATVQAVTKRVSPGIVDVISQPFRQSGSLEGTGMILSSSGLVLTNNHVVEGTASTQAKIADTGRTYKVTVLGYDQADDVALLKLNGATNLTPVPLGNSSSVHKGDAVIAMGNAEGQNGPPRVVTGHITGLDESIQASDQGANTTEKLHGMLQTDAPIISGDSGGALVNTRGQVIGMNTAANSTPNAAGGQATNMGFAIPINRALNIARQIAGGHTAGQIRIGQPAFLGVTVARGIGNGSSTLTSPQQQLNQLRNDAQGGLGGLGGPGGGSGAGGCLPNNDSLSVPTHIAKVSSGALISGVLCGTPVATAGVTAGSVITSIDGHPVSSPATLTQLLGGYHPNQTISVTWVAPNGQQHTASLKLAAGPVK